VGMAVLAGVTNRLAKMQLLLANPSPTLAKIGNCELCYCNFQHCHWHFQYCHYRFQHRHYHFQYCHQHFRH